VSFSADASQFALTHPSPWATQASTEAIARVGQVTAESVARYTGSVAMAAARQVLENQESQANLSLSTDNASAQSEQAIDIALAEFQHTQNQIGLIPQLAASDSYQSPLPDASMVPRLADNYDGDVSSSHVAIHRDYYWPQFAQSLLAVDRRQTSSVNRVFSLTGPELHFFGWFQAPCRGGFLYSNDFWSISSLHYFSPNPSLPPPPDPFQYVLDRWRDRCRQANSACNSDRQSQSWVRDLGRDYACES
jgi:hypothetical protein